jgi:hypothetical protein
MSNLAAATRNPTSSTCSAATATATSTPPGTGTGMLTGRVLKAFADADGGLGFLCGPLSGPHFCTNHSDDEQWSLPHLDLDQGHRRGVVGCHGEVGFEGEAKMNGSYPAGWTRLPGRSSELA